MSPFFKLIPVLAVFLLVSCGTDDAGEPSSEVNLLSLSIESQLANLETNPISSDKFETLNGANTFSNTFLNNEDMSVREKVELNNRLVRESVYHLNEMGQSTQVVIKMAQIESRPYAYLSIMLYNENFDDNSRSRLNRLAKKVNIKSVALDMIDNALKGSGGFFRSATRELSLGGDYIVSKLAFDDVGGVARHELAHGMFSNLRAKGIDSVYHLNFLSQDGKVLNESDNAFKSYNTYISAEEMYNYVANMYWIAKADMGQLKKYSGYFLNKMDYRVENLSQISEHIAIISSNALISLQEQLTDEERSEKIIGHEDRSFYYFKLEENLYVKDYSTTLEADLYGTYDFVTKYYADNELSFDDELSDFSMEHQNALAPMYQVAYESEKRALKETIEEVKVVNRVANFFIEENEILKEKFEDLKLALDASDELADNEADELIEKSFVELRTHLRTFINKSREWHGSFVGLED